MFLGMIGFWGRRSDDDGMGTLGRHIGNIVKRSWKGDLISSVRKGRGGGGGKMSLYAFTS